MLPGAEPSPASLGHMCPLHGGRAAVPGEGVVGGPRAPCLPSLTSAGKKALGRVNYSPFLSFPFCSIFCNSICCKENQLQEEMGFIIKRRTYNECPLYSPLYLIII